MSIAPRVVAYRPQTLIFALLPQHFLFIKDTYEMRSSVLSSLEAMTSGESMECGGFVDAMLYLRR